MGSKYTLGIDPGNRGAIACLDSDGVLVWVEDMPVKKYKVGKRYQYRLQLTDFRFILDRVSPPDCVVWVEKQWARPLQDVSTVGQIMLAYGLILGWLKGNWYRTETVSPQKWKRGFDLGSDKAESCQCAAKLWPESRGLFYGPRGGVLDGRAEACLIAEYGRTYKGQVDPEGSAIVALLRQSGYDR